MKLILSRKGFDSSAGGVPSPIFPDGRIVSLPIPDQNSPITYESILAGDDSLGQLVADLAGKRVLPHQGAHLDPDLAAPSLPRLPNWRPIFGQTGQAQSHLRNNGVGPGDLFLFFGLFREVARVNGTYIWKRHSRPCHLLWGWLQVAEILHLADFPAEGYDWAHYHPHFYRSDDPNNVLYLGRRHLRLAGQTGDLPGAAVFPSFSKKQQLTKPCSQKVSLWELPGWFYPGKHRTPLTYHADSKRWQRNGDTTELNSVGRGQEFILDCDEYPEAIPWAHQLIRETIDTPKKFPGEYVNLIE